MALTANLLRPQVDLPVWEWLRFAPVAPTTGLTCSCVADNTIFNPISGRYIYYLINATNFWKYDTVSDGWEQLSSPPNAPVTTSSMRFAGAQGYYNRVISASTNTLTSGLPFGGAATGYNIKIISGKGAGQERVITSVSDPIVADFGAATAGSVTSVTDTGKNWGTGYVGSTWNVNNFVGYSVRVLYGTGATQVRKILYNSATVLTVSDPNFTGFDPWANVPFTTAPAANSVYQIESSVITVDTAWDIIPDATSRFVIKAGGIYLMSGAAAAPFYTFQYYDVLADVWYTKPAMTNVMSAVPTDVSLEKCTENSVIWDQGIALGTHSTTTLQDTTSNWATNQFAGYQMFLYSGTGRGQLVTITSNTSNTLTFPALTTVPDNTTRYRILGFDGGTVSSATYNSLTDSTQAWTPNAWTNYAIVIVAGTGAGQMRKIESNTATSLTMSMTWATTPDTTSKYIIQGYNDQLYFSWGGSAELNMHKTGDIDTFHHSRTVEEGVASVACALLSNASHTIQDQPLIAITSLAGTSTITATTATSHNFRVGQYVSIRGVTSAAADQYNVTGLYQITTVPSVTTFTYTPFAAGTGTYAYLTALATTNYSDASKDFRDVATGGSTTTVTFARVTPSNINGWWVTGTNIGAGARVVSGAGTTTLTLSATGAGTPSGAILFSKWGPQVTGTYSSGGATGALTVTLSAATPAYINGWYVTGTGVGLGAVVTAGAGTATITLSVQATAQISGTLIFSSPDIGGMLMHSNSTAPVVTTGVETGQIMNISNHTGATFTPINACAAAPVAGVTKYLIGKTNAIGANTDGSTINYVSGIVTSGTTTTLVDANAFWSQATGCAGTANTTTITLGAVCPTNVTGWYVTGTNVGTGAKVVSGAGTTTITVDVANSGSVGAAITLSAWNTSLVGRRVKVFSGATGLNQELAITAVAPTTGTLTFATATAPVAGATYSILSLPPIGPGHELNWVYGNSVAATRGKYLMAARGGSNIGFNKLDISTDRVVISYVIPNSNAVSLGSGSMYAYDGQDRFYYTKDLTNMCYYLDVNTFTVHGAGMIPYNPGGTCLGNRMEIFSTIDGLKYLWAVRQLNTETFRTLLFY